ncbi:MULTISPECIES: DUF1120 domain-containing protein [Yersinia]|uniref:DUF1120 domain-containing protein n=1 Tax=Yersinia TaxID=629 RepID=UPI0005EA232C|nr:MULTISPECIES: DUF1120 domain-containing protein [Yersinia]CQJ67417.1 Protein of uncharacterised function (DUF1120) [Yersinia intermedia]
MRKTLLSLTPVALVLLTASGATQAADTATLTITGTVAPSACVPSFSNGGVVDFGTITSASLNPTGPSVLEPRRITFSVNCEGPVKVAFNAQDNRVGTAVGYTPFSPSPNDGSEVGLAPQYMAGLGTDSSNNNIGSVRLTSVASSGVANGATADILGTVDGGAGFSLITNGILTVDGSRWHTWGTVGSAKPVAITTASVEQDVAVSLNKKVNLDLTNAIHLDGNVTYTLVYL